MRIYLVASGRKELPPDAPTSLTATAVSSSRIDLSWTNNATSYDGTKIERSTDGVNFTEITDVASGVSTYASTGLSASTQYYYRVRAYKGALNSTYSNTADATTSASATERIIQIDTTKTETGSTGINEFRLVYLSNASTNFTVDWGDGTSDTVVGSSTSSISHTYASSGVYDIKISGAIKHNVNNLTSADKKKYIDIKNWGLVDGITSVQTGAFYGCSNMKISATDYPISPTPVTATSMFRSCTSLTNENFSSWSALTFSSTSSMFNGCTNFNGDVSWVRFASSGVNAGNMFNFCSAFTGIGVENWNTSGVTSMSSLFSNCPVFNGDISQWDVSNVATFTSLLSNADSFTGDLSLWDVRKGNDFGSFFNGANLSFNNTSIESWNIGANVTGATTIGLFGFFQSVLNNTVNLTSWNTIRVNSIGSLFGNSASNYNYGVWDLRNVFTASSFMSGATTSNLSAINLANMYIGWSQQPLAPVSISFGTAKYDASAASARAILTAPRAVGVTGATDPNADGTYTWNGSRYQNPNGWYFTVVPTYIWRLWSPSGVNTAESTGSAPLVTPYNPASAQGWTGTDSGITVTMVGAGWTITDGGQL